MTFEKALTIGPDYRTLKGGIASVLSVYAKYDPVFKFLPTYSSENNFLNILGFPKKYLHILFFLIANREYKIVHIHGASQVSFYRKYIIFLSVKYLLGRKVIYHIHGGAYHKFEKNSGSIIKKSIHHMIDKSNAIICLSNSWKQYYTSSFHAKRVFVLNNIIPKPKLNNKIREKKIIHFLFLGKIYKEKGIYDLLEVIQENKDYLHGKVKITIGGNGETDILERMIDEFKVSDIVEFIGWVSGEKKDKLLAESDIFILPSYYEGLPISILEAMSYRSSIISTDVGGISTIVKNDKNGFLIKPRDKNAIFNSIQFFIENKEKIEEFGKNSFKYIEEFLPDRVIEDLHKIYNRV